MSLKRITKLNMIGILGGMGTQAGLDFCNKLAILNRGKIDQDYPLFLLYNKSNIPGRPESIGIHTKKLSKKKDSKKQKKKYQIVLKSLLKGCKLLYKSKCKFIVIPCNTAHYWYDDLRKKIKLPIINMPKEVFNHTQKICKKKSSIGLLATEGTILTGIYNKYCLKQNWNIANIDSTIILQEPIVKPYIEKMKDNIHNHTCFFTGDISIKATTTDHLGFIGEKKGIAVISTCLLVRDDG